MFKSRILHILKVISAFKGKDGEPENDTDRYLLSSMWIMMLAEFEGSIKTLVEGYIDRIKKQPIENIHVCLLLQNFFPDNETELSLGNVISVYKRDPKDITYRHFTKNYRPKYKSGAIEKLFNSVGIFFSAMEMAQLAPLDAIASTRDSIAHGDHTVEITKKELVQRLLEIEAIYEMLELRLS